MCLLTPEQAQKLFVVQFVEAVTRVDLNVLPVHL